MKSRILNTEFIPARGKDVKGTVIALHGLGDCKESYRWLPDAIGLPSLNYILVDAPDRYFDGYSWFNIDDALEDPVTIARSRELLFKFLDELNNNGFPTERIVLFGFSQGCLMSWEVGIRYPKTLAGIIGVSGWASMKSGTLDCVNKVSLTQRFLITHGIYDPLLPVEKVRRQIQELKQKGLKIEYHELPKDHTILGEVEIPLYRSFIEKVLIHEPVLCQ
jgi:phospholipase/carboxylesterase